MPCRKDLPRRRTVADGLQRSDHRPQQVYQMRQMLQLLSQKSVGAFFRRLNALTVCDRRRYMRSATVYCRPPDTYAKMFLFCGQNR